MREFLTDGLRVFIITMILILGIGGALITGGRFDFWGKRLSWRRKKKRIDYH